MAKPITETPLYTATRYFYIFFMTNLYFIGSNLLFFIVFFLADFTYKNILLFYVSLIPMGPSLTAIFSAMGKLVREKDINPTSTYWKAYRKNFGVSMKYWLIQLSLIIIFIIDLNYVKDRINVLSPVFFILLVFFSLVTMYAFPIMSRFEVKIKNLFIISIYSIFKFFKATILNATSIVAFGIIFIVFPSISALFVFSLVCFFMMFNLQTALAHMENEMSKDG